MTVWNPEAIWKVKYLLKPEYRMEIWKGAAPTEESARMFATMQLLEQGYQPGQFTHVETQRIN